jgi:hypothetical protein
MYRRPLFGWGFRRRLPIAIFNNIRPLNAHAMFIQAFSRYTRGPKPFLKEDGIFFARLTELDLPDQRPPAGRNQIDDEPVVPLDELVIFVEQAERVVQVRRHSLIVGVLQVILGDHS